MTLLFNPLACRRSSWCRCRRRRSARCRRRPHTLGLTVGRMAVEHPAWCELAKLVADHFLGHQHWNVLLAVVDAEVESNELRQDGRATDQDLVHIVQTERTRGLRLS